MKLSAKVVNLYHLTLSPLTDERAMSINNIGKDLIRDYPDNVNLMALVREAGVQSENYELEGSALQTIQMHNPEQMQMMENLDQLDTFGVDREIADALILNAGVDYNEGLQELAAEIAETNNKAIVFKPL